MVQPRRKHTRDSTVKKLIIIPRNGRDIWTCRGQRQTFLNINPGGVHSDHALKDSGSSRVQNVLRHNFLQGQGKPLNTQRSLFTDQGLEHCTTSIIRHPVICQLLLTVILTSHCVREVQEENRKRSLSRGVVIIGKEFFLEFWTIL